MNFGNENAILLGTRIRQNFTHTMLDHDVASDRYKLVALRLKLWNWLKTEHMQAAASLGEETVITNYR